MGKDHEETGTPMREIETHADDASYFCVRVEDDSPTVISDYKNELAWSIIAGKPRGHSRLKCKKITQWHLPYLNQFVAISLAYDICLRKDT